MKFANPFRLRSQREQELDDEIRAHLAMAIRERIERGENPIEAEANARREFGNATLVKEFIRDMWGWRWLETLVQDVRYGLRQLRRNPGFTAVAVITLALGIGANTAIFSVVDAILVRPLPYPNAGSVVFLRGAPVFRPVLTPKIHFVAVDWLNHTRSFSYTAIYERGEVNLAGVERPERLRAAAVTSDFFRVLGTAPYGRAFAASEDTPGRDQVAILSLQLCRRFGSPSTVVGRSILVNGMRFSVAGVMPAGFSFPGKTQIWIPLPLPWTFEGSHLVANTTVFTPIALLRPGVTLSQARDEVVRYASAPPGNAGEARKSVEITPLRDALVGHDASVLLLLLGAVGFVLLIACADVANLLLMRAVSRKREVALRSILGASGARLIRQSLTESILLSCLGGAAGLLLAVWSYRALRLLVPPNLALAGPIRLDVRALGFALGVSVLVGLLLGLFVSLRAPLKDPNEALKESGQGAPQRPSFASRGPSVLVVSEVALTLILLAGAGLLAKSLWRLSEVDPGFNPQRVITARINLAEYRYRSSAERMQFYREVLRHVGALPGVRGAAVASSLPLSGAWRSAFRLRTEKGSQTEPAVRSAPFSTFSAVSLDYFHVMGIPLLAGRPFLETDGENSAKVAIVSESLARAYWGGETPIGKHIALPGAKPEWREIIGVVGDTRDNSLTAQPSDDCYVPIQQWSSPDVFLAVRTAGKPILVASEVRRAVSEVDQNEPLSDFLTMEQRLSKSIAGPHFRTVLLASFAALALALAVAGIYGVTAFSVTQRTHEIGIRMALGADRGDALKMFVGQGLTLALIGVAIGVTGALALTRLLASLLYGVESTDPLTFVVVSLIVIAVALLACYIPARRAMKVDPMVALRYE